jgi:hypothetical protein
MIKRLRIFDFDGTLFNSPDPPDWWKDKDGWWGDIQSMTPPALDTKPSDDWWIAPTVKAVQEGNKDPEAYTVLLTGRQQDTFKGRVHALIKQKGLKFDEIHLADQADTQAFKVDRIDRLIEKYPDVEEVDQWEDMIRMVRPYRATVKEEGLKYNLHKVKVEPRKADFPNPEDKEIAKKVTARYLAKVRCRSL